MIFVKTAVSAATLAVLLGTGALVGSSLPASARMVCNNSGDCWHSDRKYNYDRQLGAQYHNDDWYFHQTWNDQRHYRDSHEGRGYYKSGVWVSF